MGELVKGFEPKDRPITLFYHIERVAHKKVPELMFGRSMGTAH
jgi:hypothetical protein